MPYSAPLDGLRAIAIFAVLIFHIWPAALKGGFTGVDVFFTLSGYLITGIVLHDLREDRFSLLEFYLRRVQRLLPNVVVTVLAVQLLWLVLMPPSALPQVGRHGLWTIFSASNFYILNNLGGYWGDAAKSAPLTHTWSLGVEEQFYLLFPGSLLLLVRFGRGRPWAWLAGGAMLSFAFCCLWTPADPSATFYLLPTRVWELLIGAALAAHRVPCAEGRSVVRRRAGLAIRETAGAAGATMILAGFRYIDQASGFPGIVTIVPTLGAALVLWAIADRETLLSRLLSTPFMVGTGKRSYSLYLWHWPLITLGMAVAKRYEVMQLYGALAGALVGILSACAVYTWVEQPLRRRGPGRSWRLATTGVGFTVAACSALVIVSHPPVADPSHRFAPVVFDGARFQTFSKKTAVQSGLGTAVRYYDVEFLRPATAEENSWRTGGVIHSYGGGSPNVVVLGSSHGLMYSSLIDDICRKMRLSVAYFNKDATSVFLEDVASQPEVHEFNAARMEWLKRWHPKVVFMIDRWDSQQDAFEMRLRDFVSKVGPLTERIVFVAQVPVLKGADEVNQREAVCTLLRLNHALPRMDPDENEPLRKQSIEIAEAMSLQVAGFRVLRPDRLFYKKDGSIRYSSGRSFFYADDDHLSEAGAEQARSLFEGALAEALGAASPTAPH